MQLETATYSKRIGLGRRYSEKEVFPGGEGADEDVVLVNITAHIAKGAIDWASIDANFTVDHNSGYRRIKYILVTNSYVGTGKPGRSEESICLLHYE